MQNNARIQAVIELLEQLEQSSLPADLCFRRYTAKRRYIGSKDRREIASCYYGIMRQRGRLTWHLAQHALSASPRLLCFAFLLLQERVDDIATICDGHPHSPPPLNTMEEEGLAALKASHRKHEGSMPHAARANLPGWLYSIIESQYRDDTGRLLDAMATEAPVMLRCNQTKRSREQVLAILAEEHIEATADPHGPDAISITTRQPLQSSRVMKEGLAEIQDTSSQLAIRALAVQPGWTVLDYCAGAGGKTLALAEAMQHQGHIIAYDTDPKRIERLMARAHRAGCDQMISPIHGENESARLMPYRAKAELVLVDAPCSGSGTWRRNPELRWRHSQKDLARLISMQREILAHVWDYVKPGGMMAYMTCSLLDKENIEQGEWVLQNLPDINPCAVDKKANSEEISPCFWGKSGMLAYFQCFPHIHDMDGFFMCAFQRAQQS